MRTTIVVIAICSIAALALLAWNASQSRSQDNRVNDVKRSTTLTAACCAADAARPASIDAALPVVCTLGVGDVAERGKLFATQLEPLIREVKELDDGYALRFDAADGVIKDLAGWIDGERECCAFLNYRISVEAGGGPIWFDMTGSPDAKQFVGGMLDVAR